MIKGLISIIFPAYNVEKYIRHSLESILKQTYKNIEIICVNDGSTDSTPEIINSYALSDSRIKVINKPNGGLSSARNAGIDSASGEYYAFVDSDDYVADNYIERLFELAESHNADIARCRGRGVYDLDYVEPVPENPPVISERNALEALEIFYDNKFYGWYADNSPVVWNCLYKAWIFDNLRFEENLKRREDECFTREAFSRCKKIVYTDERLYFYYHRQDSIIHTKEIIAEQSYDMFRIIHERRQASYKEFGFEDIRIKDARVACDHMTQVYNMTKLTEFKVKKKIIKTFKFYYSQISDRPRQLKLFNLLPSVYKFLVKRMNKKTA